MPSRVVRRRLEMDSSDAGMRSKSMVTLSIRARMDSCVSASCLSCRIFARVGMAAPSEAEDDRLVEVAEVPLDFLPSRELREAFREATLEEEDLDTSRLLLCFASDFDALLVLPMLLLLLPVLSTEEFFFFFDVLVLPSLI